MLPQSRLNENRKSATLLRRGAGLLEADRDH
jgi:hypothetical protein